MSLGSLAGPLIGAGTSLLGGILGGKQDRKAAATQFITSMPKTQVKLWEAAGINPIFGLSTGAIQSPAPPASSIGDSFAHAGGILARGLELDHKEKLEKTKLEQENEELRKQMDKLANRGEPGHMERYGGVLPLPSQRGKNGQADDLLLDSADSGPSPFPLEQDAIGLPKRDVYNLYVDVYDPTTDRWMTIPNPDLMDAGPIESAYAMAQLGAADAAQNIFELGGVGAETGRERTRPKARPRRIEAQAIGDAHRKSGKPMTEKERKEFMREFFPTVFD